MALPNGTYYIRNALHPTYHLTYAQSYIVASSCNLTIWDVATNGGITTIRQHDNTMTFDLEGGVPAVGTAIIFYADGGRDNQQWTLGAVPGAPTTFYIRSVRHPDREIGMQGNLVNRGVRSYEQILVAEHQWRFIPWVVVI